MVMSVCHEESWKCQAIFTVPGKWSLCSQWVYLKHAGTALLAVEAVMASVHAN